MRCFEVYVSGRVQGVGFRWFARQEAQRFGICGHVKNLYDGRVEVVACGDDTALEGFLFALRQGNGYAHVTGLNRQEIPSSPTHEGFRIVH